jgi:hypothetical protein
MDHAVWQEEILAALAAHYEEGREAAGWLRAHRTRIGFRRARRSVGAVWTPLRNISLNSHFYGPATPRDDPYLLAILVHEAVHLRQGFLTALSITAARA